MFVDNGWKVQAATPATVVATSPPAMEMAMGKIKTKAKTATTVLKGVKGRERDLLISLRLVRLARLVMTKGEREWDGWRHDHVDDRGEEQVRLIIHSIL